MIWERETIGNPECPILFRWTLVRVGTKKVMLHRFLPNSRDRDPHDHPWSFVTVVLAGSYLDVNYRDCPRGIGQCESCRNEERMTRGKVRFRPALHTHQTVAGPRGCWTLVLTFGGAGRPWGFWRDNSWWTWKEYDAKFGHGMKCE